ncbi:hypothetical protein DUNSADRAFT_2091 [Dunaliella salina]|uniref:Uncharacterized protein n=1 Tax=Dunaliella salina TaxID=3046 RepID=A0ABQ7GW44_DUNSA|nr:hypothetical protein DUNSADRAFT_2091 [Dunaliella salina]|eukprot:KAF5838833.1 hypothetical protein DUNSADRAFT_2091 [Dunaliella salina]
MFVFPGRKPTPEQQQQQQQQQAQPRVEPPPNASGPVSNIAQKPTIDVDLGWRNALLGIGIGAVLSARYFKQKLMLRPFQASVITAWPSLGVAVMQTVIANSSPVEVGGSNSSAPDVPQDTELAQRLRKLAEASRE